MALFLQAHLGEIKHNHAHPCSTSCTFSVTLGWKSTYDRCTRYDISTVNGMGKSYDTLNRLCRFFPVFCISLSGAHSQRVSRCCTINTVDAFILRAGANAKSHGQYRVHKKLPSSKANARSQTVSTSVCLHNCQAYQPRAYAKAPGPVQKHFCMKCY